eukprot:scaffold77217_cov34-Attheya_sp.AAC.3
MSDYMASGSGTSWEDPIVLLFSSDEEDSVDDDKENEKLCYSLENIKTDPLVVATKGDGPKTKEESADGTITGLLCDEIYWAYHYWATV